MPGVKRRPSIVIRIETRALTLAELVKPLAVQQPVQLFIKWMIRTTDQLGMRDPKLLLPLPLFASAHPHTNILKLKCFKAQDFLGTLTTGC